MKNKLRRIFAAVLAITSTLSLAACGAGAEEEAAAEPEYVYRSEFSPVSGEAGDVLRVLAYTDTGAYAICSEKVGRDIPEGADVENMTEDDLSRFDVYATNIYFIDGNNHAAKLPDYKPLDGKENPDNYPKFYSQSSLDGLAVDGDGNLLAVETVYTGWYDGPEGKSQNDDDYYDYYKSGQEAFIRTLSPDGTELSCAQIDMEQYEYLSPCNLTDSEGNFLCRVDSALRAYGVDGELAYQADCGDYFVSALKQKDGGIYLTIWGDKGLTLVPLDMTTKTLGEGIPLPNDAYDPIPGGEYDFYYTSGMSFYGYDLETKTAQPLFNWINCNVNSDELTGVRVGDDGVVRAFVGSSDYVAETSTNETVAVSKTPYDPTGEKQTLTLACMSLQTNVQDAVIQFNRSSDSAQIVIKDYSEYNTPSDDQAGAQKFLTETMAGDIADIVALEGLPYRRIASKGLLEDLYPYLDSDSELSRDDFYPNVLSSLEVNGKLCSVSPSFYVAGIMGAVSVVGDRESWTYEDFNAALAAMPEGCKPFGPDAGRDDVFRSCLLLDMPDYVNWDTGECNFDSEQFIKLLNFAKLFQPASENSEEREAGDTVQKRIQSGEQMLLATTIYSLDDVLYDCSYFGGQEVRYIGFPTYSGNGNALVIDGSMAVSSSCQDKAAAWEFLRSFLTAEYQKKNVWSIPTNIEAYDYKMAQLMKVSYEIDENGQFVLDENGEKIKEPRYTMSSDDGPVVNIYALSKEQADEVTATVSSVSKAYDYDESIVSIAMEESAAFFAGQKTAEETAKLVQSKANIYVNEQS